MSFVMPDLVLESIIRDGIQTVIDDPTILDDVFSDLLLPYASRKYGAAEITRIKSLLTGVGKNTIAIVHSFAQVETKVPCFSIQMLADNEATQHTFLDDFISQESSTITDVSEIAELVRADPVIVASYSSITGMVRVNDATDLSEVSANHIFVDGTFDEFTILPGISNETGDKFFFVAPGSDVSTTGVGKIKSFINTNEFTYKGSHQDIQIVLGVHTKEPLLTKYLYTLLKYFLKSRKYDIISRGIIVSTMSGSDFLRDVDYQADLVYDRYITVSGKILDSWRSDQVTQIDSVEIDATPI